MGRNGWWCMSAAGVVLISCGSAAGEAFDLGAAVRPIVQQAIDDGSLTSMVVGVVTAGGQSIVGFGRVSADNPEAPDGSTVYELGTLSMVLTAALLGDLSARNDVDLDAPVQILLPQDVTLPQIVDAPPLTLAHLATHTSGLPTDLPRQAGIRPATMTRAQLFEMVASAHTIEPAGAVYEVNRLNAALAGEAVAAHLDTTYEQLLRDRVLGPLGMDDTGVTLDDSIRSRLAARHDGDDQQQPVQFDAMAGAIGVRSTGADMLQFVAANLDTDASPIGPSLRAAHEPRVRKASGGTSALFWTIQPGGKLLLHRGQAPGFAAVIFIHEAQGIGVVVLASTDQPTLPVEVGKAVVSALRQTMRAAGG